MKIYKNNLKIYILVALSYLLPNISFAQLQGLRGLMISFKSLLDAVIPVIFGLAFIYFFWGTAQFILHAGDLKTRDDGKKKMIWGVIALFVMISIYGIISAIGSAFNIPSGGNASDIFNLPI